jgi:tetratricopeptide (TPR) repeat protein
MRIIDAFMRASALRRSILFLLLAVVSAGLNADFSYCYGPVTSSATVEQMPKSKKAKIPFYLNRGDKYLEAGNYSSAIMEYNEAYKIKRNDPIILLKLGEAHRVADMPVEAADFYNSAIEYGCKDVRAYAGLGLIYKSRFLYEKAEGYLTEAVCLSSHDAAFIAELADVYESKGEYLRAIYSYQRALELSGSDAFREKLAKLYVLAGDYKSAERYVSELPQPGLAGSYLTLVSGKGALSTVSPDAGIDLINAFALLRKGNNAAARQLLAVARVQGGDSLAGKLSSALYGSVK